ncbi:hypothetical protein N8T08_000312 [Aspergillus melleus]|uniref:Uncharacterized protein n=1 Tax=Aspergillus melleus TaxID=138277 RepID=A0ACC3BC34_9EURO|nr:hypothetical protein N8T08_000312 [Aspergillus melleus]
MPCHIFPYLLLALNTFVAADVAPIADFVAYQSGRFGLSPNQTYYTSNVTSPIFLVNTWDKAAVDNASHIFLSYGNSPETGVGMLFSANDLSLVWFQKETSEQKVNNVGIQKFQGNDYLVYWLGKQTVGHGNGHWVMLNPSYDIVYNITTTGLPVGADFHEFRLTDEGTALITVYNPIPYNLRKVGGWKKDTLLDSVFQEVDVITGKALFTWHAIDHFSIADTFVPYYKGPDGWDWCHINSIEKTVNGNYVVSFSFCSMVVYIDGTSGIPIWIMGGKKNQFTDRATGRAPDFAFQHDPVFHDKDLKHLTMADGEVVLDLQFGVIGRALGSYRVYKRNWEGYPTSDPSIVVQRQNASSPEILYVSWNGATEVKCWALLASASVNPLRRATVVDAVPRAGYETAILVRTSARFIRAAGLDAQKNVLGMSAMWDRENESMVNIDNRWQFEHHCSNAQYGGRDISTSSCSCANVPVWVESRYLGISGATEFDNGS